jgi:hypothetical protein
VVSTIPVNTRMDLLIDEQKYLVLLPVSGTVQGTTPTKICLWNILPHCWHLVLKSAWQLFWDNSLFTNDFERKVGVKQIFKSRFDPGKFQDFGRDRELAFTPMIFSRERE